VLFVDGWQFKIGLVVSGSVTTFVFATWSFVVLGGRGKPEEATVGKVAAVEGSEAGCAGADDAQLELDDGPHADVEAGPAHVGAFGELHEVVCPSYAGTDDAAK
jgi:hypothetical protein